VPVPAGATTGNVVVTVGGVASNGVTFTVTVPAPSITSLSPTSGLVGVSVTISGANFGTTQGTSTVTFRGVAAAATSWSATSIVVPVPAGATTGNVVVTVGGVASNGVNFTVPVPTPSITSLNPTTGLVGTPVTIAGANFGATQGTSTLKFNGTAAAATSWSAASITAAVPSGATTGNVVVTVGGAASNGVSFTVQADTTPPTVPAGLTVTAISSSQINLAWTASTDNVGVTGYNIFRGGVKIGTAPSTSYQDAGLTASTNYTYNVSAFDAAGNTSVQSAGASATTQASGGGGIPSALGWYQIPNTQMANVCPPGLNCANVVIPWSGGAADTLRNRLIVWGGGHTDYSGNEVYALDLNALTINRLNNPSTPSSSCVEVLPDGTPPSRHTYDALTYFPDNDAMVGWAGSMNPTGCTTETTWALNLGNVTWTNKVPASGAGSQSGYPHGNGGAGASDYDPNTKNMYAFTEGYGQFAKYNFASNLWTALSNSNTTNQENTAVVDPKRKRFYIFGGGETDYFDISGNDPTYNLNRKSGTNCTFASAQAPGVAYDSVQDRIVGWAGGNTVYLYNMDTDSCTSVTYANGPGAQQSLGTYGRFRYFPGPNIFALVNDAGQNAFALRLTPPPNNAAEADFAARCGAPGVTKCVAFDTMGTFGNADVVRMDVDPNNGNLRPRSDGQYRGTIDTAVKKSGIGSLRFQLDAGYAAANIAGEYIPNTNDGLGGSFGENSTFYVQYAVRFSPEMKSNLAYWDSNWKVAIIHEDQASCAAKELTLVNHQGLSNYLWMYKDCGASTFTTLPDGQTWTPSNPPYLSQQGAYFCDYGVYSNCWSFPTNTWITFYYKVHYGVPGQNNSTFESWYAINGQPYVKWLNILSNFDIGCNGNTPCPTEVFNNLSLLNYMTGLTQSAPLTAYTWYDELIVSTQPIAAPNN